MTSTGGSLRARLTGRLWHRPPRSATSADGSLLLAPRWVAPMYATGALLLLPWTVYLAYSLPRRNTTVHYDLAWVGFDCLLVLGLARTAWFAYRGRREVELPAVATATLLIVDAWFDVTTSRPGWPLTQALVSALLVELPTAVLSIWIARHADEVAAQARQRRSALGSG